MSSPPLPALPPPASLQPAAPSRGFVTARSALADLQLQYALTTDTRDALNRADSAPTIPKQPVSEGAKADAQDAPPAPKRRGRPKKSTTPGTVTATTVDASESTKPAPKRSRKKIDTGPEKPKPPPKPRKTKAAAKTNPPIDNASSPKPEPEASAPGLDLAPAPRRRRDWTPPLESDLPPSFQRSSASPDTTNNRNELDFNNLMGNFGYQQDNSLPPTLSRNSSDAPTTKRKRLDPVDVVAPHEPQKRKKKESEPKPKPPKKPKAPKKKPVTITALATAAYRPQLLEADSDQPKSISDFFAQPQPELVAVDTNEHVPAKPPKPTRRQSAKEKPPAKSKRTKKVQITVPEVHVKLDSPEAARENLKKQHWLFGSSSQLAAAESPTELRDLQQALKESEDIMSSQNMGTSHSTSYTRVPSAPHGTSLSVGQAHRVLWMSAARDFEDSTFASDESSDVCKTLPANNVSPLLEPTACSEKSGSDVESAHVAAPPIEITTISSSAPREAESPDSGYVDIDQLGDVGLEDALLEQSFEPSAQPTSGEISTLHENVPLNISSNTEGVPKRVLNARDPNTSLKRQVVDHEGKTSHITSASIAQPVLPKSPGKRPRGRPRKALDGTALVLSPKTSKVAASPEKGLPVDASAIRPSGASQLPVSSPKPRGRPRKVPGSPVPVSPPRPRGRPPKLGMGSKPVSPPRPRGRPRKSTSPHALPTPSRLHKLPPNHGIPSHNGKMVDNSSDYLDIDAISDAEVAARPPSPFRSPSKQSPNATLEFDKPPPPISATLVPAAPLTAKQLQAEWPSITPTLYPRITETIRSTPPSSDHKAPTWHEKILLYDPIVLEDLTAWLNAQGLRIEVARHQTKRKKKANAVEEAVGIGQEELQPWMVQKWCEEHSVCCLWKEGLRGGVRQRY